MQASLSSKSKPANLIACLCASALLFAPLRASAEEVAGHLEPGPEKSAEACQDGADNDGDGKTDCHDSDCHAFSFCAEAAAPPAHWKTPVIVGAILLPVSIILAVGSIPLWYDALDLDHPSLNRHFSGQDGGDLGGAAVLTAASLACAVASAVMITRGVNRKQKSTKSARTMPVVTPFGIGGRF